MGQNDNLEVEVKFWVADLTAVRAHLIFLGASLKKARVFEKNIRFDTPDEWLRQELKLLRLRQDTAVRLTFKGPTPADLTSEAKVREELEITVSDFAAAAAICERLGFAPMQVYEKYRETWQLGSVEVVLDELPFGDFVELEGGEQALKTAASQLKLDWQKRILNNYLALMGELKEHHHLDFADLTFANFAGLPVSIADILPAPTTHDTIFAMPQKDVGPFCFDENVAQVFPDMITRSVPGYALILPLIGLIAARYVQPHSYIYDLGSSLGAVTLEMRHQITRPGCRIIAVDNSAAMIARCRELLQQDDGNVPVELVAADIQECPIERASVVVLNFTLQFVAPEDRYLLLQQIYHGMLPGGVLVLSEKVVFADAAQNERFIEMHHDFKRTNGYSELEVSQKRVALENVLIPDTIAEHQHRLYNAGFATAEVWFQAFNFMSILAIKPI